ncbi:MAG: hypothetical protein HZB21_04720 [Deltaproteobacteria bacterium]|nr:hypothetical protein [Deltaproteobacteria bacterium]
MKKDEKIEMLSGAFGSFREASLKLEAQYAALEKRIEELNAELAEKNRAMERQRRLAAMGEMAAKIAHEIRNPLASINIFASLLEREFSDGEAEKRRLAGHITKGVKVLDNILSNMLLFTNSPPAHFKPVNIREAVTDALMLTRGREKGALKTDIRIERGIMVMGDGVLLRQLFLNLCLNALDAMEDGGELVITAREIKCGRSLLEVDFRDTGCGISSEDIDRIFDPFFSAKERGTGLGLAIVSSIAGSHGGTIKVRSKPGNGSVFTLRLPVEQEMESLSGAVKEGALPLSPRPRSGGVTRSGCAS